MPTNTTSIIFTPGLKVGFFGPNGSFHHGIIAGLATLPQVSRIWYVNFIFIGFWLKDIQDGRELFNIVLKGEKAGKEKQYRLPSMGLVALEG
jgi:hypothetical protein